MSDYVLSCCSTADLSKEHFEERDIRYTCFNFYLDGVCYPDDLGQTISSADFYQKMRDGADTKTSQINADEYTVYFETFLKEGKDLLHVCLSSGITGAFNSAMIAKRDLEEKYPDRKIIVIDSLAASSGCGLLMDKAADLRDAGMSIEELGNWIEENKRKVHHWFFSTDLTFYVKGGRVSKTAGFVGSILNICPLLNVNCDGKLIPREKIRTKKKVIQAIVDKMEQYADDGLMYSEKCYMCHSDSIEDAKAVAALVEERFPNLKGKVEINNIGTVIGSHSGPGTVALFFWGKERNEQ